MSTYIHLFESNSEYNEERESNYKEPWVSYTVQNEKVNYNKSEYEKLLGTPLTFEITSNGTINWVATYDGTEPGTLSRTIEYKKNNGEWTEVSATPNEYDEYEGTYKKEVLITVSSGDTLQFRGNNQGYSYYDEEEDGLYIWMFGAEAYFNIKGNIMSLIDSNNFSTLNTLQSVETFNSLFSDNNGLTDASNLILPATALTEWCYPYMFKGCSNLTKAPELPATTLAEGCYYDMFENCTSLTRAPELPATTLANNCYQSMFNGCTSLSNVPELPATTLAEGCYSQMFSNCTNLENGPSILPATTLISRCYLSMFYECTSLTGVPELPATTLAEYCYQTMFYKCTSLTTAPELPATSLVSSCYESMFAGCTSLTTAPELPATTLAESCYSYMFFNCTNLNYIKCLATSINASSCTNYWVGGVQTNSGTFVKSPSITESTWGRGHDGIPNNWTVEDAS